MMFEDKDPETGGPNWGCPRLSAYGAGWLIDWYDASGSNTGASVAKGDALEWIRTHPEDVARMQAEVSTWLKGLRG